MTVAEWFRADAFEPEAPATWDDAGLRSHQRIAARFATFAAGRALYVDGTGWHYWDGARWAPDASQARVNQILTEMLKVSWMEAQSDRDLAADVKASMTATGSAGVLSLAARKLFAATVDVDPWLLNCKNGTLDLHSLELRPHDPKDLITKITGAAYDPSAPGEAWRQFLASSLPDPEVRGFFQRYAGLALIGKVIDHVMVIATGSGRNGKGVIARAMKPALGDYAISGANDLLIAGRKGEKKSASELSAMMDLRGARWVEMSEIPKGAKLDEANTKHLVGGDVVPAKLMGKDRINFEPSHSFYMLTNDLPAIDADSEAVWARIRVVPFTESFIGREDHTIEPRIAAESSAVLAWAVEGLREYQKIGLAAPKAVLAADAEYRQSNDPVSVFVSEECIVSPAASAASSVLFEAYADWARRNGDPQLSSTAFGALLKRIPGVVPGKVARSRGYSGIGLAAKLEEF
ncbi:putative DNA primase/helicase [Arthrobacter ginsengisoli]|uniref:DNA primase/helicase n=1 Tax=Arthrobacter ginsengisoli TaxID=1356565 RepID=A0ABU1U8C8_9MICC|nr:phage/plasmid primase, P4 family [Arthrobacter ginsengisoli]MDR7081440.1 putative DNA primase/helicase [Arthrobacter ginsengisoli]